MSMYKCMDCDHKFQGDLSTMQCPSCGSTNITTARSGPKLDMKWILIAVAILFVIGLISIIGGGEKKMEAKLSVEHGLISIEVEGPNAVTLFSDYKVVIFDDQNQQHGQAIGFFKKKKVAQYSVMQLLEGHCYTFNIERKDGKPINNLVWNTSHEYCVPAAPVKPEIERIEIGIADHEKLVWNHVKVIMKKQGIFTYTIGNQSQSSNEFNNLKPGTYMVKVENEEGISTSQSIVLKDIVQLAPPLTLAQVQEIFDKVSSGGMSASAAQEKLAEGNVDLEKTIEPDIKTLWGALMEASMGERFKVNHFDNDPNTNKIKSGSLNLSRK